MKVTEIRYARRFKTGDYEYEEYAASATVGANEKTVQAFVDLKTEIAEAQDTEASDKVGKGKSEKPNTTKGKVSKSKAPVVDDEDEEEIEVDEDDADDSEETEDSDDADEDDADESDADEDDDESDDEDSDDGDDAPTARSSKKTAGKKAAVTKAKAAVAKAEPKKVLRKKGAMYSRANDQHKKLLVSTIKEKLGADFLQKFPKKAKSISAGLDGQDFLDAEGEVLPAFVKQLVTLAKKK